MEHEVTVDRTQIIITLGRCILNLVHFEKKHKNNIPASFGNIPASFGEKIDFLKKYKDQNDRISKIYPFKTSPEGLGRSTKTVQKEVTIKSRIQFSSPTRNRPLANTMTWFSGPTLVILPGFGFAGENQQTHVFFRPLSAQVVCRLPWSLGNKHESTSYRCSPFLFSTIMSCSSRALLSEPSCD